MYAMSEEPFSYGYYEGTTGDLLLVSMRRCARCYCGRGLATSVIIAIFSAVLVNGVLTTLGIVVDINVCVLELLFIVI